MPTLLKLDMTKLLAQKDRFFQGKRTDYADLILVPNRDGRDDYGNDGFIAMSVSREERENGQRGEIVGNWKATENGPPPRSVREPDRPRGQYQQRQQRQERAQAPRDPDLDTPEDEVPF